MTCLPIRFMSNNFIPNGFTYSSQLSSFPAVNCYNTARSKVWKPAGNFEIDATNNEIYINDGSDLTVSLTAGAYTYTTLASHIQTQLNASSSNWTCTYSSTTFKFTINRTSGTAVLRLSQTTNAAWDVLGYVGNLDRSTAPFPADEQRNHTSEWVKCDIGVNQLATFIGVIPGIDEQFSLSSVATIKLQANNIDLWTSPPVDITVTRSDYGCLKFLDDDVSSAYRYWRVKFVDRTNTLGPEGIKFPYIYVGDHKTIANSNIARGYGRELVDQSNQLQSENGTLFVETRPRFMTVSGAEIQLLSGSELLEIEQLFYDLGQRTLFFCSIDPGLEISTELGELTRFMIMARNPTFQHVFRNYYNISFEMREVF